VGDRGWEGGVWGTEVEGMEGGGGRGVYHHGLCAVHLCGFVEWEGFYQIFVALFI
jgi:hypothetical protein